MTSTTALSSTSWAPCLSIEAAAGNWLHAVSSALLAPGMTCVRPIHYDALRILRAGTSRYGSEQVDSRHTIVHSHLGLFATVVCTYLGR